MFWPLATTNCASLRLKIAFLWQLKCCVLWLQQTVSVSDCKQPPCDYSNGVAFGYNKLWHPPTVTICFMKFSQDNLDHFTSIPKISIGLPGSWKCVPLPFHPKMSPATWFHFNLNIFTSLDRHVSWRCGPLHSDSSWGSSKVEHKSSSLLRF